MARNVRISALGPASFVADKASGYDGIARQAIRHWDGWIDKVLPETPDLIVLHEACDRPSNLSEAEKREYYHARGLTVLEHMRAIAKREGVNIAFSSDQPGEDGRLRNRTSFIGRNGEICGFYNKNHLVWEENTEYGILFGKDAPVVQMDFGTVAGVTCFDLNFDELREKYEKSRPELLVFCSMYHGGFVQQHWAYSCRSWFVGAVSLRPAAGQPMAK